MPRGDKCQPGEEWPEDQNGEPGRAILGADAPQRRAADGASRNLLQIALI